MARVDDALVPLGGESVLGIDIGSTSIKVVQLKHENKIPRLETYGEIDLSSYKDQSDSVQLSPQKTTAALLDLLHSIEASARSGAMSVPLSSTLITIVDLPERDPEQMRRIIHGE